MKYFTFATLLLIITFIEATMNAIVPGIYFDRIFLVIFENTDYIKAIQQPYLQDLMNRSNGLLLSNYFAIAHPSLPNYIATVYGSTAGITDDDAHNVSGKNIVDLLEANGITWKAYMENYPGNCFTGDFAPPDTVLYARKHNPFISMVGISTNPSYCSKIVPATQLDSDITSNKVPQFAYYVPNQNNDGHDTGVEFAMDWFEDWFESRLQKSSFTTNTLFFITFDEDDYGDNNHIFSGLFGYPVKPPNNHSDDTLYNHYSFLSTVEENWDLEDLGRNDVNATPFTKYLKHN
ncbi:11164_t:CDS:2 [Scutellospora calospora]|uniref:11164_t:CDS:1 n=1 Tax=Scutellospora calospora TaxID=85575 RepID=A0ACA9JXI8_9GLOM|nr:11164_t:CDS:2 [Scutellospora calospora]